MFSHLSPPIFTIHTSSDFLPFVKVILIKYQFVYPFNCIFTTLRRIKGEILQYLSRFNSAFYHDYEFTQFVTNLIMHRKTLEMRVKFVHINTEINFKSCRIMFCYQVNFHEGRNFIVYLFCVERKSFLSGPLFISAVSKYIRWFFKGEFG